MNSLDPTTNSQTCNGGMTNRTRGRYMSQGPDRHPPLPHMSTVLMLPRHRPGRIKTRRQTDPQATQSFGDAIVYKDPRSLRIFFQNVKGLTYSSGLEDYKYYMSQMAAFGVDCFGLAETNTAWQQYHLQLEYKACVKRQFRLGKTVFGYPTTEVDRCSITESFQAGGCLTTIRGQQTTTVQGPGISDPTGLGRWSGITLEGKGGSTLSLITVYRVCEGSVRQAPLGSAMVREHEYYRRQGEVSPQPRQRILSDLRQTIMNLQNAGHSILIMMDANGTVYKDKHLQEFIGSCDLSDLHSTHPAPSTFIGSANRRIDYIFGCPKVVSTVMRQGSLAYIEGPQSDHRGLYVDLRLEEILGDTVDSPMDTPSMRSLYSGNPELVATYLSGVRKYYETHNMTSRIQELHASHQEMTTPQLRKLLCAWDNDQGRAMMHAEKILNIHPKTYKWSPKLRNAGVIMRYWKLRLREILHGADFQETFQRWETKIQEYDSSFRLPDLGQALDVHTVRKRLNEASKQLHIVQKHSLSHRQQSFQDLLDTYDGDTNPNTKHESKRKAKIVRRTLSSESNRSMFSHIKNLIKPGEYSPLTKLKIPREKEASKVTQPGDVHTVLEETPPADIMWDTIISREEIEDHLVKFNRDAFRAAASSPCGNGTIHDALTFTSLSPAAEELLRGIVPPSWHGDDMLLKEFLASFTIPNSVQDADPIPITISSEDFKKGILGWKESTTTSPSGRHLGHYKALVQDPILLDSLAKFLDIVVTRGISIPRWQKAVNVMIEKDKGDPKINRLRIIHLFEADYNLFLKLTWGSRLVRRAVQMNLLNSGQHGSTPGKTTMEPVMLTQLTADMSRLLKTNYARFDNDASACFDRIIVALGMLAARRCGMPINAVRSHAQSLELMRYMVKTVYGVSEKSYTGTPFAPLFGTGQGSGASSPAVWLTLVVILLNTLERVSPLRMSFRSSDGVNIHSRLVDAFVDGTALGFTDNGSMSFDDLVTRLEDLAQTWEKLLHYSGGSLNLSKCSWFVMYWDWRSGRPILREQTTDPLATVRLSQGQDPHRVVIRRQPFHQATRILGVYQNPIGDFSHHVSILKKKADEYASRIQTPRLTSSDIRVFVRTTYEPAMRYSLPALAIDEEELEQIQTKILPTIVQKLGMNRNLPTAVRHGPLSMGGLGLMDLRTECGIEMAKYFRHHIYRRTEVGELLVIQLKTLQLEAGILPHLLEHPTIVLDYLTPTWILSLRQFLSNHNMTIHVTDVLQVELKGHQDTTIMDPDRLSRYSRGQQRDINLVRLYLQCFKLSDLCCSNDHRKISQHFLGGDRPPHFELTPGWPRQERPSAHQRRLWRRYISSNYLRYGDLWKRRPIDNLQEIKQNIRSREESADLSNNSTGIQMEKLPLYQRRLLSSVRRCVSEEEVWEASRSKKNLTIASDGGLKDARGTFGWTLSTSENITLYEGSGPVDGPRDVANSTRCEIAGLAAPLLLLSLLIHQWGTKIQGKLRWVCDSKAALSNVEKHTSAHKSSRKQPPNADLLAQIRSYRTDLRLQLLPTWIKGHQSTKNSSKDVIRNNRADELATEYRNGTTRRQSSERTVHIPESRVSIWIQGIQQVGQVEACIRFHINGYHLRQHLQARHKWTDAEWNTIDLQLLSQFCKSLTPSKHTAQVKFMNNQRHTGLRRYKVAKIKDPTMRLCPCCLRVEEDDDHVLQCIENPGRETALRLFRRAIDAASLLPSVKALKHMLLNWLENTDQQMDMTEYPSILQSSVGDAVAQQSRLGWSAAMRGFFTVKWRYLVSVPEGDKEEVSQAKGLQTMRKIIRATHDFSMSMWKARNHKLHSPESQGIRGLRCPELVEITHLHAHPELISAGDRHFCERPLGDLLRASHSVRRRWILYMRNARARYEHDGKTQTAITEFFKRA